MKKIVLSIMGSFLIAGAFAQTTFKNDKFHSQLKFDITHTGVSTVSGSFTDFEATVTAAKPDFSDAVFQLTAKTASISTGIEPRDNHLKTDQFFDVAAYPTLSFTSTSVNKISDGKYTLNGNLTMHGVTKPVVLDLWYRGTITNPMSKKEVSGFRATGKINRSEFGIGTKFPGNSIGEEVTITADGEFSK